MTTFSEQFPIVFQALNVGFLQTLKLFFITLIGAIPLGRHKKHRRRYTL